MLRSSKGAGTARTGTPACGEPEVSAVDRTSPGRAALRARAPGSIHAAVVSAAGLYSTPANDGRKRGEIRWRFNRRYGNPG